MSKVLRRKQIQTLTREAFQGCGGGQHLSSTISTILGYLLDDRMREDGIKSRKLLLVF